MEVGGVGVSKLLAAAGGKLDASALVLQTLLQQMQQPKLEMQNVSTLLQHQHRHQPQLGIKRARSESSEDDASEGKEESADNKLSKRRAQIALASRRSRAKRKAELTELREQNNELEARNSLLSAHNAQLQAEVAQLKKKLQNSDGASSCSVETAQVGVEVPLAKKAVLADDLEEDEDLKPLVRKLEEKVAWLVSGMREDVLALMGSDLPAAKKRRFMELSLQFK
jgi:chromosome segregation ATPase